jgi:fumarate hydratase, class II
MTSIWASRPTIPSRPRCISRRYALDEQLLPKVAALCATIERKAKRWEGVVKIGRTHLEDAVPLTVGQEWYGWAGQIRAALANVEASRAGPSELAVGGTAVGTGLNAPPGFPRTSRLHSALAESWPRAGGQDLMTAAGGASVSPSANRA